jgi:steroid 5-alpha reductase family enzyme
MPELLPFSSLMPLVGWASLVILGMMLVVTAIANPLKNAGIVDVAWAFGFSLIAGTYFLLGDGFLLRKILMFAIATLSSWRLAWFLLRRVMAHHPEEDGRYHVLRQEWGPRKSPWLFFGVFLFQGALMMIVSSPFAFIAVNPNPEIKGIEWMSIGLWAIGALFEAIADQQLSHFKQQPKNKGKVCKNGLWAYSRHPNYFFEWLQWLGYYLFAVASPGGWLTLYSPLLMLFFLTKMTGVAATEAQALKTKGEAYRLYQQTTSPFIPWFPKRNPTHF